MRVIDSSLFALTKGMSTLSWRTVKLSVPVPSLPDRKSVRVAGRGQMSCKQAQETNISPMRKNDL